MAKRKTTAPQIGESADEDHLSPAARACLEASDDERVERIRSDRWIGYPRANEILDELEELFEHPRTQRMPNLLIVGSTNNGKTAILNRFLHRHPVDPNPDGDQVLVPVLYVQTTPGPDEAHLYRAILKRLNALPKGNEKVEVQRDRVIYILDKLAIRMLVLDEVHNVLTGPTKKQRHFLNVIKYLGNELRIPIVGAGTREAYNAIQVDEQIANRFDPMWLPKWKPGEAFDRLLASYERVLPLRRPSNLADEVIATKLMAMSEGLIGELARLLGRAAVAAIRDGTERIDTDVLKRVRWTRPSDRRKGAPNDA